jgi:hypothetical protein
LFRVHVFNKLFIQLCMLKVDRYIKF